MKLVFSHPTGNANVRAAALGLAEASMLAEFHTTMASFSGSLLDRLGDIGPLAEIRRRNFDLALKPFAKTWPWRELGRHAASKMHLAWLTAHETGPFSIDAVYQDLDRQVASGLKRAVNKGAGGIFGYEDGAAFSFRVAKALGVPCFYELPTGYWRAARRLLETERERQPEWAITLTGFSDSDTKLARKDEELLLADRIFVASRFTASTLADFPSKLAPIEVIPYGFPPVGLERRYTLPSAQRPLKLLFVGKLSQQKGIADLFAAVKGLEHHVKVTIVGRKASEDCPALDIALTKHRWFPSLPHEEVLKLMREHDVLIFPSLFDGFGLVITEAMSQGTPVITTERSAGPDLIEHGRNGWLFEAGSIPALRTTIEQLLYLPQAIAEAGREAMETARCRPWEVYRRELASAIQRSVPILDSSSNKSVIPDTVI